MTLREKVGKKIRHFRIESKFSQEELAFRTDLHQSQIYRLENGKQRFNSDQIEKIAKVLKVPVIRFFESDIEIKEDIDEKELFEVFSQMRVKRRKQYLNLLKLFQGLEGDMNFKVIKKLIEIINMIKK